MVVSASSLCTNTCLRPPDDARLKMDDPFHAKMDDPQTRTFSLYKYTHSFNKIRGKVDDLFLVKMKNYSSFAKMDDHIMT